MIFDDMVRYVAKYNLRGEKALFTVDGMASIAFEFIGFDDDTCLCVEDPANANIEEEAERDEDGVIHRWGVCMDCDGSGAIETEMIVIVAVGDDHARVVDPSEVTPYEGDVCRCGQIGCEWH